MSTQTSMQCYMARRSEERGYAAGRRAEMPLPSDPKVISLGGLFVLALMADGRNRVAFDLCFHFLKQGASPHADKCAQVGLYPRRTSQPP